jgi:hypothetical protein
MYEKFFLQNFHDNLKIILFQKAPGQLHERVAIFLL